MAIKYYSFVKTKLYLRFSHRRGTSSASIGRYERNEIPPSVDMAAKIAEALELPLDYLVGNASTVVKRKKMLSA